MIFLLLACNPPKTQCNASIDWINNPSMPIEIAKEESFCDFYQFSWQWFLAQGQEIKDEQIDRERVFEQNRIYQFGGIKNQCQKPILLGRQASFEHRQARIRKSDDHEKIEADRHALYDQNGNILNYNIYYSPINCKATDKGFLKQSLEIKASWMLLSEPSDDYLFIEESIGEGLQYYGLVGIHLAIFTPNHPEAIWATWEHKNNAPLCNGESPVQEYNFASKEASECLHKHKSKDKCSQFNFNVPHDTKPLQDKSTPINVCREFAYGSEIKSVNGNDTKSNIKAIKDLNDQLVGNKGLLTTLSKDNPMQVWSNYQMIGALWTKNGAASGKPPVPSKQGKADANSKQRGSLELTNMSMETFQQGDSSTVPNCFGCHNYLPDQPLNVSHIQQNLKQTQESK